MTPASRFAVGEHSRAVAAPSPSLSGEVQADVAIIGAGYTGLSAGRIISPRAA